MPIYDWFNQETMWSLELFVLYIYIYIYIYIYSENLSIGYLLQIGLDLKMWKFVLFPLLALPV